MSEDFHFFIVLQHSKQKKKQTLSPHQLQAPSLLQQNTEHLIQLTGVHNHASRHPGASCRQLLLRPSIGLAKKNLGFPTGAHLYQQGSKLMLELQKVLKSTRK